MNPFRWHAILETPDFYQTAEINTRTGSIDSDPHRDVLYKPTDTAAVEAAKRTELGKVYLDWGTWAVVRDVGQEPIPGPVPGWTRRIFRRAARGLRSNSATCASIIRFSRHAERSRQVQAMRRSPDGSTSWTATRTPAKS